MCYIEKTERKEKQRQKLNKQVQKQISQTQKPRRIKQNVNIVETYEKEKQRQK